MKLKPEYSHGSERLLAFATAMVVFAEDREVLLRMATAVWPDLDVYRGGTHWRFMPYGKDGPSSFYVDFSET